MTTAQDRNGTPVAVGTQVRVVSISASVLSRLPADEVAQVKSMEGEVFSVYEIDQWGGAWVEKWWHDEDKAQSHSLGLASNEMEVVPNGPAT
ncbi:MAG: hypothetical protein Q7J36_00320 [Thiobacillus sp.]|nr:hypothetical protein [Thiobacillus sp.]